MVALVLMVGIFLPQFIAQHQCPSSTFQYAFLFSATGAIVGIISGILGCICLPVAIGEKLGWWQLQNAPLSRPPYYDPQLMIFSIVAVVVWAALTVNNAEAYSCATPGGVIVRKGLFSTPRALNWNDVRHVHAWCWIAHPRNAKAYPGVTLELSFADGEETGFSLVNGDRVSLSVYQAFRDALSDPRYVYEADSTVTPDECPPALYRPLRDWAIE